MHWKCPSCGSDENLASELRCTCGNEVSEGQVTQLQFEKVSRPRAKSLLLRDSIVVITIALIIAVALKPFAGIMPEYLGHFVSHNSTFIGYLAILKYKTNGKTAYIWKVSLFVWLLLSCLYSIAFYNKIGAEYTIGGIIFGTLWHEIVSVSIAMLIYNLTTSAVSRYKRAANKSPS